MAELSKASAEEELGSATLDYITALRLGEGFKEHLVDDLRRVIMDVAAAYAEDDSLPKSLVNKIVGLYSWIESAADLYSGAEAARIRATAGELEGMIIRYVVPENRPEDPPQ